MSGLGVKTQARQPLTYLADELNLDAVVLKPLSRVLQRNVDFPRHRLPVVEEKILVLPAVFAFMLSFLSRFGVIQNYIDVRTLTKSKEAHGCSSVTLGPWMLRWKTPPVLWNNTQYCSLFSLCCEVSSANSFPDYWTLRVTTGWLRMRWQSCEGKQSFSKRVGFRFICFFYTFDTTCTLYAELMRANGLSDNLKEKKYSYRFSGQCVCTFLAQYQQAEETSSPGAWGFAALSTACQVRLISLSGHAETSCCHRYHPFWLVPINQCSLTSQSQVMALMWSSTTEWFFSLRFFQMEECEDSGVVQHLISTHQRQAATSRTCSKWLWLC